MLKRWLNYKISHSDSPSSPHLSHQAAEYNTDRLQILLKQHLHENLLHAPMGCILLGKDYQVLGFNTLAAQCLGLKEHDLQRPLTHLLRSPHIEHFLTSSQHRLWLDRGKYRLRLQRIPLIPPLCLLEIEPEDDREAAAQAQRHFLATVSHELNTPLTVINGFLELLECQLTEPQHISILERLRAQTYRLSTLAGQLLQLLRAEQAPPRFQTLDPTHFFGQLETETQAMNIEQRSIIWNIDHTLILYGDESSLYSAFRNLIDNAIRYTSPENGQIHVIWQRTQRGYPIFEVQDNGAGIAPEHLPRLGERFFRAGHQENNGTGLGLSLVKQVVQQHQAEFQVNSTVGKGSIFRILMQPVPTT